MPDQGFLTVKVRSYMEALSPTARAMLGRTLRAAVRLDTPGEIVLRAVESLEAVGESEPARVGGEPWSIRIERAFFAPVEPFLDDEDPLRPAFGRVARRLVPPIWAWIRRDLAPAAWERALAADPLDADADAAPIARKLRREVVAALLDKQREIASDAKARQKLAGHIGGEAAFRCLADVGHVLQHEAALANFFGQLPPAITLLDVTDSPRLSDLVRTTLEQGFLGADWIAAALLTRTGHPAVLANLACRLAASTDPRLLAGSRWAPLIDAVVGRIDEIVARAAARAADPEGRDAFVADLRAYHDLVHGLEMAMPIANVATWFRRLGAARTAMSQALAGPLEAAPGLVRRALRIDAHAGAAEALDPMAVAEAEFAVRLALEARHAADSLAVNELVQRTRKQIEGTLEIVSSRLMDELRSPQSRDRALVVEALDAAIGLCAIVFGEDHAAVMRRTRDLGAGKPTRAAG